MKRRLGDLSSPYIRLILGGQALLNSYTSITNPSSALHDVARTIDGGYFMWAMGLIGIIAIIDMVVNDVLPEAVTVGDRIFRLSWDRTWSFRHWFFLGIAGCYLAQIAFSDVSSQALSITVICIFWTCMNILGAFVDAGERSRRVWWQTTCS